MNQYNTHYLLHCCIYGAFIVLTFHLGSCKKQIKHPETIIEFSQKTNLYTDEEWIEAGQLLFESRSLSPKKVSCKSCHEPKTYFQDGYEVAIILNQKLTRNTPTLLNINRYTSFFWDGRANSIRKQLEGPLFSRSEMHSDPDYIYQALHQDSLLIETTHHFDVEDKNQAVEFVMYALEKYIFSITTKNTKFHTFQNGQQALTKEEQAGYEIFINKAKCSRCHTPPNFTDNQYHDIGLVRRKTIFESYTDKREVKYRLGPDYGRGNIVAGPDNLFTFRTPSLINAALTAPYMHDGIFNELEEVIDFYSRNDSLLIKQPLTTYDKKNLITFLKTLNDEKYLTDS